MWMVLWFVTVALAVDSDLDGFDETVDCDDSDASVFPGAVEMCDAGVQVDQDCDGNPNTQDGVYSTSEDTLLHGMSASRPFYVDADMDGFADVNATQPIYLCRRGVAEEFYSTDNSDCNDSDATIHPDASELCNDIDDNCNGEVDDPNTSGEAPQGTTTMFLDMDADGYGSPYSADTLEVCPGYIAYLQQLAGGTSDSGVRIFGDFYSLNDDDCYDDDAETYPRPPEYVEKVDGRDNDCDGMVSVRELDCDQDGACPIGPDVDCTNLPIPQATCGEVQLRLVCNPLNGEWLVSTDELPSLYTNGLRMFPEAACSTEADDCDDNDAGRSFAALELCDGFDTSCVGTDGQPVDGNEDGLSDALQGGIPGFTQEQLLDTDDDGDIDACDPFGPERLVVGSGPSYSAPVDDPDPDSDIDATPGDNAPSGCSCNATPTWRLWSLSGLVLLTLWGRRRR